MTDIEFLQLEVKRLQSMIDQHSAQDAEMWEIRHQDKARIAALEAEVAQLRNERDAKQWYPFQIS